ncbi:MAG TPA: TraR/DksA C4-type zinc finger protein [Acidimicrobiia bacterium]
MAKGTRATAPARAAAKTVKSVKAAAKAPATAVKKAAVKKAAVKSAAKTVKSVKAPAKAVKKAVPAKAAAKAPAKAVKPAAKAPAKTVKKAAPAKAAAKAPAKAVRPAAKAPAKAVKKAAPAKAAAKSAPPAKAVKAAKAPASSAPPAKAAKVVKGPPALVPKPAPSRPVLSEVVARKHRSPAVAASTLERLRVLLLEEQEQHVRQAEGLLAEAEALANEREPGDTQFDEESGEGDTLSVERERDLALSASANQTVIDIEKALVRMADGTYGYCEVCGDRIPVPRLEAIPWADQCVKCKSRGERRR